MQFPNVYAHRRVADTASKGCDICYRPTSSVLLSNGPDGKDFFYVCVTHLKDRNFCTPIIDQAAIDAKKKKELEDEVERVKKEYEEKKKKKEEEKKKKKEEEDDEKSKDGKEKEKDKDKGDKDGDKDKESSEPGEKKDNKSDDSKAGSPTPTAEEPRVFALHRTFYQQRVEKRRQMEIAKRNRERLQQPNYFPSVPKGLPGA